MGTTAMDGSPDDLPQAACLISVAQTDRPVIAVWKRIRVRLKGLI